MIVVNDRQKRNEKKTKKKQQHEIDMNLSIHAK